MSWENCVAEIRAAAGEGTKLSDRDIEKMLETIMARARRLSRTGVPDPDSISTATAAIADEARRAGLIQKRNELINLRARLGRRDRIESNPNGFAAGIRAEIHGTATPIFNGRFSAEAEGKALARRYVAGAITELDQAGLLRAARSKPLERLWGRELYELSKGTDGNPGVTKSPEALKIAKILDKYQSQARADINKAGAAIGDYSGYITSTSHDPDKIRRAGLAEWKAFIKPRLDPRTFDYVAGVDGGEERFLDNVFYALRTGVHMTHEGMQGFKDPEFAGPGNLAKRVSQERVLHFTDADAWLDYHERFAGNSLVEDTVHSLERSARATALMHHFGTNPRAEFDADMRYLGEKYRNDNPDAVEALRNSQKDLQNRFDFLDGTANTPARSLAARIGSVARVTESMAKLGGVMLTHLPVGALKAAELKYQGIGLLRGYGDYIQSFWRGRGARDSDTREIMDLLLAGTEGMHRDLMSRFELDDSFPGTMSKLANSYFKLSGLTYVLGAQRAGGEFTMSRHLGSMLDRDHAALPAETRRVLGMYGIDAGHWSLLRQVDEHADLDGRKFLTPDAALRIPDAAMINHLFDAKILDKRSFPASAADQRKIDGFRDDLTNRLYAYYADRSAHIVIEPGIATRGDFATGLHLDPQGQALRFIAQFKTWPAALVRMALGREVYGRSPEGTGFWQAVRQPAAMAGILHMAVMGTVLGYAAMSLKDLFKGRNPRDPSSPKTWAAALLQGGGLGILGDYLFGEYNRFGQNFSETLLGPVIGQGINSVLDLWNRAKAGQDLKAGMFNDVINNTPFLNLFYSRTALDYMFLWQIQEALNPGYMRRFERKVRDQNHQTFWLSPSAAVTPGYAPRHRTAPSQPWHWLNQ